MHWRQKAAIQRAVARLPRPLGDWLYYRLQRNCGSLREETPVKGLVAATEFSRVLRKAGRDLRGEKILEVGTGRRLLLPITFWLLGAQRTVTVDLHAWLRPELVEMDLCYLAANGDWFRDFMKEAVGDEEERIVRILALAEHGAGAVQPVMAVCGITYHPGIDPGRTEFHDGEFSLHVSNQVLEHVPLDQLAGLMTEGKRLIHDDGLLLHRVDHTDHFSHSDPSIPLMNFLRFSDRAWDRLAGNRFMYMNRLRIDDYKTLFEELGLEIVTVRRSIDEKTRELIERRILPVDERFASKTLDDLATAESWFLLAKR